MYITQLKNGYHRLFLSVTAVMFVFIIGASSSFAASILVLGDSLSAGYGMASEQGWVGLWQKQLSQSSTQAHRIINASISGETSAGGLARLPQLIAQHRPDFLVIELGANDALRGQDLKRLENNLSDMIEQAQSHHISVLLLGIQLPSNYGTAFNQRLSKIYTDLATRHQTRLDPFFLADLVNLPNPLQADGLHPTAEVQPAIMARVARHLPLAVLGN